MHDYVAVLAGRGRLPNELGILVAPVCVDEPSHPDTHVGDAEGVLLDRAGNVQAFVLHVASRIDSREPRLLVPASAMRLTEGPVLHASWTADQIRALPWLDGDLHAHNRIDGGRPLARTMPPGSSANTSAAIVEGFLGCLVGSLLGFVLGLMFGGPTMLPLVVFFGAGVGLTGALTGLGRESAAEASELTFAERDPNDPDPLCGELGRLRDRLSGSALASAIEMHLVTTRPFQA